MSPPPDSDFKRASAPLLDLVKSIGEQASRVARPSGPREDASCPRCRGARYLLRAEGTVAVARPCGCSASCAACHDRGVVVVRKDGYEFSQRCECQTLLERIAAYNDAQIPGRFVDKGFDQFYVHGDDPKELQIAKRQLLEFAEMARPGQTRLGKGLVGGPGRGKTHLLAATLTRLTLGRGLQARYIEISFLFADLKAAISDPRARATADKVDLLAELDVLAIDELGKGRGSVFEQEILDELIGRRYNNGKLTLFATNHPRQERPERPDRDPRDGGRVDPLAQSLRVVVGERVYSRLHEMVEFLDLPAASRDRRLPPSFG